MSTGHGRPCPKCQKAPLLRFSTDLNGRLVETVIEGCEHERRRRGICKVCDNPVRGKVKWAKYCSVACNYAARRERENTPEGRAKRAARSRKAYRLNPEKEKARRRDPERKKKAAARARRLLRFGHPSREKVLANRRARYARNAERERAAQKARYWANPEKERARARENREFRERKRDAARAQAAPPVQHPEKRAA